MAHCNESSGEISLFEKIFSLRAFQIYHAIHGKAAKASAFTPCSLARNNRKSMFEYIDSHGNNPGDVGIAERAQH